MAIQKIYLHPNNLNQIRQLLPNCFTKMARSNTPSKTKAVLGAIYHRAPQEYYPQYQTYGYSPSNGVDDYLKKVDDNINRICCYLDNFPTEEVNGIVMPYIEYDTTTQTFANNSHGAISIVNTSQNNNSNLEQTSAQYGNTIFSTSGYTEDISLAIWGEHSITIPSQSGERLLFNFSDGNYYLAEFFIDAEIPIFVDATSARDYIENGNVQVGKCFNLDEMMLSEPTNNMISSQTYEYDENKDFLNKDEDKHTIYIRTFEGQKISAYVTDDGARYNVQINVSQYHSDIDTLQYRIGAGTFETITISDFMNSQYSKWYTWRDFKPYGINGFVKGNMFRSTIPIYSSQQDSNLANNGQEDKVVPLNFDNEGKPVNMSDTGAPCNTESDLDNNYKDGASGLITLYQLSSANLRTLGDAIFDTSASIGDLIKDALSIYGDSPINAIISVYHNPIDISAMCQLSNDSVVRLGLYNLTCEGAQTVLKYGKLVTIGETVINSFYNDFRDFQNFEFELHLPFSSPIPLNAREIMNKTLTIKATCDAYAMQLRYYICIDGIVQKTIDCAFGHQVAIMGNDFAGKAKEVRQEMLSLGTNVVNLATGTLTSKVTGSAEKGYTQSTTIDVSGATSELASMGATINNIATEPKKTTVGSFASGCAESDVLYPYLSITETASIKPANLISTYGAPTNYIGRLGNLHGFTCAELVRLESNCLEEEKNEIIKCIAEGIIL